MSASNETKTFKDPVLGQITLHPLLIKIVDTKEFQRLRNIKQLGPVYYVYPGATHSRFEHSIGVCHLANQMLKRLKEQHWYRWELSSDKAKSETSSVLDLPGEKLTTKDDLCILIAALCHELGQGPMSHLYQDLFLHDGQREKQWKHLQTGIEMFDYLVQNKLKDDFEQCGLDPDPESADMMFIKELMYGGKLPNNVELKGRPSKEHWFMYEIVSNGESGIDVDKMEYIIRDCHGLGIQHSFDWQRFIESSRLIEAEDGYVHICSREKVIMDLYELFHVRDKLFREAYQHKTKRAIEHMLSEALRAADPHIELAGSNGRLIKMSEAMTDMCAFTQLTDDIFGYIRISRDDSLRQAKQLLDRVERRELYKCVGRYFSPQKLRGPKPADLIQRLTKEDQSEISPQDLLVDVVKFDYGKDATNPLERVWCYRKDYPNKAIMSSQIKIPEMMLPKTFQEFEIRLYLKKPVSKELTDKLRSIFDDFCKTCEHENPAMAITTEEKPIKQLEQNQEEKRVYVSDKKVFSVSDHDGPQLLDWEENGLRIQVPKGAVCGSCDISVKVILTGNFELPKNTELVSAVYAISASSKLIKPVQIEIQHCVTVDKQQLGQSLMFAKAACNDRPNVPYKFEPVEGGMFHINHYYADIKCDQFSCFAVIMDTLQHISQAILHVDYIAQVYYSGNGLNSWIMKFIVTKYLNPYITAVINYHSDWYIEDQFRFRFSQVALELEVDQQLQKVDGWCIIPTLSPCKINKNEVDDCTRMYPPSCSIKIFVPEVTSDTRFLYHQVPVTGIEHEKTISIVRELQTSHHSAVDSFQRYPGLRDLMSRFADKTRDKWKQVGIQLNIETSKLHGYETQSTDPMECYIKVFDEWNRSQKLPYTWATILNALESDAVNERGTARSIRDWLAGRQ